MNFIFTNSSYVEEYWANHQNSESEIVFELAKDIDWGDLIDMYKNYMGNLFDNGDPIDLSTFLANFTSSILAGEMISIQRLNLLYIGQFTDNNDVRYKLRFKADKDYKLPESFKL